MLHIPYDNWGTVIGQGPVRLLTFARGYFSMYRSLMILEGATNLILNNIEAVLQPIFLRPCCCWF